MKRVVHIAVREFIATVCTPAFIIGLLILPALMALGVTFGPRLFNPRNFQVKGEVAVIDPTGLIAPELREVLDPKAIAARRAAEVGQFFGPAPETVMQLMVPDLRLIERPPEADVQQEKAWLNAEQQELPHLALVVIHSDAVTPADGKPAFGTYDFYVPPKLDERARNEIQQNLREAIVNARIRARSLDRQSIDAIVRVPRVRSVTVTRDNELETVGGFNMLLPMAFGLLLFIGVMTGGQALLTSTVEEKSSRVIEVLLSAVSPMELMAGKLLGQMGVSMVALGLYIAMGMATLTSLSLFGLLNPWLILYLVIFFLIMYLVMGSLLMAVGSAVNEMKEAQSLMMPIMMFMIIPWVLWFPISRDPNSTLSITLSFIPPLNSFAMMLRMASNTPPPWWQVWLSIAVGAASVFGAIWFAAKVFRIGLLMYGKPPNFATLVRWARSA